MFMSSVDSIRQYFRIQNEYLECLIEEVSLKILKSDYACIKIEVKVKPAVDYRERGSNIQKS